MILHMTPIPGAPRADLFRTIDPPVVAFHKSPGRHQHLHQPEYPQAALPPISSRCQHA